MDQTAGFLQGAAGAPRNLARDDPWRAFKPGNWRTEIDVRDFIVCNVTPYYGDEGFLAPMSARTGAVWEKLQPYFDEERHKGVLAVDARIPSSMLAHEAGYIDRDNETIVGLQTDQPFKRGIFPYGGLRMVEAGLEAAGFEPDPAVNEAFTKYPKSHNDGLFDPPTPQVNGLPRARLFYRPPDCHRGVRPLADTRAR